VLDTLFHALVRYAAPVLVFTSEEVWATRFPDAESVHLLEWPTLPLTRHPSESWDPPLAEGTSSSRDPSLRWDDDLVEKWTTLRSLRSEMSELIEPLRRNKIVGSSLEVQVILERDGSADDDAFAALISSVDFAEIVIVSSVEISEFAKPLHKIEGIEAPTKYIVTKTTHHKCGRCWRHLPEVSEDGELCGRCEGVVNG
jgi:isoleucyl-tRNA synthetase